MRLSRHRLFQPFYPFIVFLLLAGLQSCESTKFHREIETPELKIDLTGNKPSSLDPFSIGLLVTNNKSKKNVTLDLEVYASQLDDANPTFKKIKDNRYSLTFLQTDNTTRELIISTTDEEVLIEEVL